MQLCKLILDNFKSHGHSVISFGPGTNAICGKNMAGKTTIVQAIGLALFDFCSGRQADYVQNGANAATITVEAASAVDDRRYEITRRIGSRPSWEVYDPQTGARIATGATDVKDWLCQHLGVSIGTDLPALFQGAVGVPQGELTVAFTQTASARQATFNTLLRIEEYKSAFDKMLPAVNLVRIDLETIRIRIGHLEGETEHFSAKEQHEFHLAEEISGDEKMIARRSRKIARLERMDNARIEKSEHLRRLVTRIEVLTRWEAQRERDVKHLSARHEEAQRAYKIVTANQIGYATYGEQQRVLELLQSKAMTHVRLVNQRNFCQAKKTQSETCLSVLRTELSTIIAAEDEREQLLPSVQKQDEYEIDVERAGNALSEAKSELKAAHEAKDMSQDGLCPFLREACRNIATTGATLTQFFDDRIPEMEEAKRLAEADISRCKSALATLGKSPNDPKTRYAIAENKAMQRAGVEQRLDNEQGTLKTALDELAAFDVQISPYANLDSALQTSRQIIQNNATAHTLYTANQANSETLPQHTLALEAAQRALQRVRTVLQARKEQKVIACKGYDQSLHQKIQDVLVKTGRQQSLAEGEIGQKRLQLETLQTELLALREKLQELCIESQREARLVAVQRHLNFVRSAIKNASPSVTARLVARISHDAQEILRSLIGDDSLGLRWEADYGITLLDNGHERDLNTAAGSERVAAALAVRLSLLQSMGEIRFAFFDEPTIHLDAERREHLVDRLLSLKNFTQLFVISHDDSFERDTNHVIRVEKQATQSVTTTMLG